MWTIRTDTRVHATAPASNFGALGGISITDGELFWDSTKIRWMPYDSGSGNVPAIGTTITQGGVSGYLLGVWAAVNTAQTAVGAAMPATGFIKFREVTGGVFSTGVLSGIGASATGPDVQGWMEIVQDSASNITVPRLGKHTARGGRFFLDNTTGVRGQTFQIPTMGSALMFAPGMFVETGVETDEYEFWPALNGGGCGFAGSHIGSAVGESDARHKYLRADAGGIMVMGAVYTFPTATYASVTNASATYSLTNYACSYTWENDVVEVYYSTGHTLSTGDEAGLQFTSGGATAYTGIYPVTVTSPYHFTIPLVGSGASGSVTMRIQMTITLAAHGLNAGEQVYCNFTSGGGVNGIYEVRYVPGTTSYTIKYPSIASVTSGNVSTLHTLRITTTTHYRNKGQQITCEFTSGGATSGNYVIRNTAATTMDINYPHSSTIASGDVIVKNDIGYVCGAGRRTWIPSNIVTEVTATRSINSPPNATIASRPEWATTSAGAIDLEYVYGTSAYLNLVQPYSVRLRDCVFFDGTNISECATALDIDGLYMGMHGALDVTSVWFGFNFAGGSVKKVVGPRGNAPGASDHAISISYCKDVVFEDIEGSIVQYPRSTGNAINVATSQNCTFIRPKVSNFSMALVGSPNITIKDLDFCERNSGYGLAAASAVTADANCNNLVVDGITWGKNFTVPNQQPLRLLYTVGCSNVKLRNCGTLNSPLPMPTWAKNSTTLDYIFQSGGSNNGVKIQRVFVEGIKTAPFATANSDKNMLYESVQCGVYARSTNTLLSIAHADLNGTIKNCFGVPGTTGQASVYGTHFMDRFIGSDYGRFVLMCNEPTVETAPYFTSIVGTPKFNSSGGVIIPSVGNQHIWETPHFIKGHTGFQKAEPVMSGGTAANYTVQYQIDTGSGYSDWENWSYSRTGGSGVSGQFTFTVTDATGVSIGDYCWGTGLSTVLAGSKGAVVPKVINVVGNTITVDIANTGTVSGTIRFSHLPDETMDPTIGFRMKIRITTVTANTTAITFLTANTLTSTAAQNNYYPLDTNTLTLTGVPTGCDLVVLSAGTTTVLDQKDSVGSNTLTYVYSGAHNVDVGIIKPGYVPYYIRNLVLSDVDSSIPVSLTIDRNYQ